MPLSGQPQRFSLAEETASRSGMSALPPKAAMFGVEIDVCLVPQADLHSCACENSPTHLIGDCRRRKFNWSFEIHGGKSDQPKRISSLLSHLVADGVTDPGRLRQLTVESHIPRHWRADMSGRPHN